ncbi:MAG: fused MFS/spermidine synthase [Gammaproteobacteria bacterium]|nr:fused MFS/spermidine synthase [Gammaproteobacteria bacterium]MDD9896885.1 fused MFS/spermidine synthase [Gammaproteobacteria bacterium]MDD9959893.1 fused MFS/spermidine synthase [Gammaproteobacteria bacterium]
MRRSVPEKILQIITLAALLLPPVSSLAETIHEERSKYRDITVTQVGERRCLLFNVHRGDRNQTCMMVNDPDLLVFDYTRMSFAGMLLNSAPQSILVIGLGGGSIPMTFSDLFPDAKIDIVEIDEAVVRVAEEYFYYSDTENMKVYIDDGRPFIKRAGIRGEKYDYIVLDAFSGDYIPEHMLTSEFLGEVKTIMTEDSVLVANTFSTSRLYDHESVTYQRAFGEFYNFKLPTSGNRIIIAQLDTLPSRDELVEESRRLSGNLEKYGVPLTDYPRRLNTRVDWDMSRRELTDQYSPGNLLRDN